MTTCVYIHIYIYTHTNMHACIHTYIHTYSGQCGVRMHHEECAEPAVIEDLLGMHVYDVRAGAAFSVAVAPSGMHVYVCMHVSVSFVYLCIGSCLFLLYDPPHGCLPRVSCMHVYLHLHVNTYIHTYLPTYIHIRSLVIRQQHTRTARPRYAHRTRRPRRPCTPKLRR